MNRNSIIKNRLVIVLLLIIAIACVGVFVYFQKTQLLSVSYKNVSKISLYKRSDIDNGLDNKKTPIHIFTKSGESIRLVKDKYVLYYEGKDGFDSKYIYITLDDSRVNTVVRPFLSDERLASLLIAEKKEINDTMQKNIRNINLYQISDGILLNDGTWYITTMKYIGDDFRNFDNLKVILHKEGGGWGVVGGAKIQFGYDGYKNVPKNVIDAVNSIEQPVFDSKFTKPATHGSL